VLFFLAALVPLERFDDRDYHRTARLLSGLVDDGVLLVVTKGTAQRAARYRFVWDGLS
jgi:hypothetical protein